MGIGCNINEQEILNALQELSKTTGYFSKTLEQLIYLKLYDFDGYCHHMQPMVDAKCHDAMELARFIES